VEIRRSFGRCLSIRGGGQLAQLRFQEIEVDGLGEKLAAPSSLARDIPGSLSGQALGLSGINRGYDRRPDQQG
jgi:hypothetical protein